MRAYVLAAVIMLVPQASTTCEGGSPPPDNGSTAKHTMAGTGSTKITRAMVGRYYHTNGGRNCRWWIMTHHGRLSGSGAAPGGTTLRFVKRDVRGRFHSLECARWESAT